MQPAEPHKIDSGTVLVEMVQVSKKWDLQAESQRHSRVDPQNPNRIAQKRWLNRV